MASECKSTLELSFKAHKLLDLDTFSKSDPFVTVYLQNGTKPFQLIGKTEVVMNSLDPEFTTQIQIPYYFEMVQNVRFTVEDYDEGTNNDFIGECSCSIGDIVGSAGSTVTKQLRNPKVSGKKCGFLTVTAEELQNNSDTCIFDLSANNLDKKDFFGKSDPVLRFYKEGSNGDWVAVHQTEVVMKNLNPVWKQQKIPMGTLCNGQVERKLKVIVYDWNKNGSEDFIGEFFTNVAELSQPNQKFELINPTIKAKKKKYINSGTVNINLTIIKGYSFLDYVRGGMEISLVIAVDLTGSNGVVTDPTSLHYLQAGRPTLYQEALIAVGNVLASYDSDNMYPVYGFGAKLPTGEVSHCFAMSGNPQNPMVHGIQNVMYVYENTLKNVQLWGPTNFAEIIRTAANQAREEPESYTILLILTDGVITDMNQTIDEIIQASDLSLSIVIVGVGDADFTKMEVLDADDKPLYSSKYGKQKRDIVQFVNFGECKRQNKDISAATLEEIPDQVVGHFKSKGIAPKPPTQAPNANLQWTPTGTSTQGQPLLF